MDFYVLGILYQNVRGLLTKFNEFFASVSGVQHDIVAITKPNFRETNLSVDYFSNNWIVYKADRNYSENKINLWMVVESG